MFLCLFLFVYESSVDLYGNISSGFEYSVKFYMTIVLAILSDGIFGSREKNGSGVHISILNELLQAMDGADVQATSLQGASQLSNTVTSEQVCTCVFSMLYVYLE